MAAIRKLMGEIKEGMVLAEPALDLMERKLFDKGRELSAKDIAILKTWGVKDVFIQSKRRGITEIVRKQKDAQENAAKGALDAATARCEHRFQGHESDETMMRIKSISLEILRKKAAASDIQS